MPVLRTGSAGEDVIRLQQSLKNLGIFTGVVNGHYGGETWNAVHLFQQQQGLPATGIVERATLAALGISNSAPATEAPAGVSSATPVSPAESAMSLHIGLNNVDPNGYAGWSGTLAGCENDARTMERIARTERFTTRVLFTGDATTTNVLAAIQDAAQQLREGGFFLLTYAGHGGQVPASPGEEEEDRKNETWCLWDRMLVDNELRAAFSAFQPGVNIVLLSDSCHSGTVYRGRGDAQEVEFATAKRGFYEGLSHTEEMTGILGAMVPAAAGTNGNGARVVTREMPFEVNQMVLLNNFQLYQDIRSRSRAAGAVVANGLSVSGCADNQLSQEVNGAGVFTTMVNRVWADNTFGGSFRGFHRAIVSAMLPTQTPQLGLWGGNPADLANRTPFNV